MNKNNAASDHAQLLPLKAWNKLDSLFFTVRNEYTVLLPPLPPTANRTRSRLHCRSCRISNTSHNSRAPTAGFSEFFLERRKMAFPKKPFQKLPSTIPMLELINFKNWRTETPSPTT
jgi:hypothetical protein